MRGHSREVTLHGFVRAADGTITTFDAPGAGTGSGQGTVAGSINQDGVIAGDYVDPGGVEHGFVRAADGTITTFDATGAGTGPGQGTYPQGINPAGAISGLFLDASSVGHGFLRAPGGAITTFDAPGAGTTCIGGVPFSPTCQGTYAIDINPAGAIVGWYVDASNVANGFLRSP